MRGRSGSSFATFLMLGPLAAIPLMAVFGVPELTSVSASREPGTGEIARHPPAAVVGEGGVPDAGAGSWRSDAAESSGDIRPTVVSDARRPRPPRLSGAIFAGVDGAAPAAFSSVPAEQRDFGRSAGLSEPRASDETITAVGQELMLQNAAQSLQAMGVEDYRLERGHRGDSYLFICQFAPGGDSRIVRRFEAEAPEPAAAVQEVLEQIREWQRRQ